jgi:DNA invertase Pin-like site-specific DNA recombinase
VIALLRVSSEAQAGPDRAGISRQREAVARIAASHGLEVVETVELHVSGASVLDEREFRRMLARLEEPGIHGVIVAESSRLMRPEKLSDYQVLEAFRAAGKLLYTPDGPRDVRTFSGRLLTLLSSEMDAHERQQIAARTQAGRERRRRAGHKAESPTVGMPRGVAYDRSRGEAGQWRYTEPEASRVREAYRRVLAGTTNMAEIARHCGWHRESACHASWAARSVLGQSLYAGLYHGVPAPGLSPPLVPAAEWEAVQEILRGARARRSVRKDGDSTGALYAGHLACAVCGAALWTLPDRGDGRGYARYLCAHARDRRCPTGSTSARLADPMLDNALEARLGTEAVLLQLLDAALEAEPKGPSAASLEADRARLENRRAARLRQHEMGAIDDRELRKTLVSLDAEAAALRAAQDRSGREIVVDPESVSAVVRAFACWASRPRSSRRALLRDLGITVRVSRPRPRQLVVESVEIRALITQ